MGDPSEVLCVGVEGGGAGKSLLIRGRKGRIAEPERRTGRDPEPKHEDSHACVYEKGHVYVDVCGGRMVDVLCLPQSLSETEVH